MSFTLTDSEAQLVRDLLDGCPDEDLDDPLEAWELERRLLDHLHVPASCQDCGTDTVPPPSSRSRGEWYMVTDSVWAESAAMPKGYLCIGCLEARLGRQLRAADFTAMPINRLSPSKTPRLNDRLGV